MPLFSRFKSKGAQPAKSKTQADLTNGKPAAPQKPRWESSWNSKNVDPEEVQELIHFCTAEMKSRAEALDAPFLLLPFRPDTDPSGARTFIRNFYKYNSEGSDQYRGAGLQQELRLTGPVVLCSIIKWCWSRMPGGVVTWPVYEGFQIGERESGMARNAFDTFIPIGAGSEARKNIIFDFFDLLAAVAAHGKLNGMGGRKLSRLAGWWAFEHSDDGKGFEGGYKSWTAAADASSHLFFAYLRSLSPEADPTLSLIERIPRSLQALLASTEYPPETPALLQRSTPRVLMIVDSVSPTPFALLRRAKHFEYRVNDRVLCEYSEFEDPIDALTDECKRVLYMVSSTNSAAALSRHGNVAKTGQESWNTFQNLGFSDLDLHNPVSNTNGNADPPNQLRSQPRSRNADHGRPTTPSWADFLSSGFTDDDATKAPSILSLPPDKRLPPIGSGTQTPSRAMSAHEEHLAPGELAAITDVELDDAFWWVWMTSLAVEEPAERKAVFGRCALIETTIMHGKWLIMEEQVKGASPDPADGVYIAPKKSLFSFTKRGRNKKTKSDKVATAPLDSMDRGNSTTPSKASLAPEQASKIKAAAAALSRKTPENEAESTARRGRYDDAASTKTSSMLTMGMMSEATPAMKWASAYDKGTIRSQYLGDAFAGKGISRDDLAKRASSVNLNGDVSQKPLGPTHAVPEAPVLNIQPADEEDEEEPSPPAPVASAFDKELAVPSPSSPPGRSPTNGQNSTEPAALAAQQAMTAQTLSSSPESVSKQNHAKLKKQGGGGGGGFKKLFGRKKDNPNRQSLEVQRLDSTKGGLAPPSETNLGRRLSLMRKKPTKKDAVAAAAAQMVTPQPAPETLVEPTMPDSHDRFTNPTDVSHIDDHSDANADEEFSRFDQGPMEDMPAAMPQDQKQNFATPVERADPIDDGMSEATMEDNQNAEPEKDRWATIRENAAKRVARASEEQSMQSRTNQSTRETDDGETSGEETIESRVARIKARVAELTGNIDSGAGRR
ncbi:hypothetical protein M433DRAFT_67457 [Acidomyces richmondensis BFW]|nr:MAG: hypothetical protein FE78DRAFT_146981 [Acidomyces sp. 'richmondensis']KYG45361.1 hypothetical protein M433DRAFT_67457 [Acidomyces richmondensis BFW]